MSHGVVFREGQQEFSALSEPHRTTRAVAKRVFRLVTKHITKMMMMMMMMMRRMISMMRRMMSMMRRMMRMILILTAIVIIGVMVRLRMITLR